jgi:hypothetical protein
MPASAIAMAARAPLVQRRVAMWLNPIPFFRAA